MKKLMVALCAVALAMVASAGTFNWSSAAMGGVAYKPGTTTKMDSGTAVYLFDANGTYYSYTAILDAFAQDTLDLSKAIDSTTLNASGKISSKAATQTYDTSHQYQLYAVVVDGDNIFIGATTSSYGPGDGKSTPVGIKLGASSGAVQEWTVGTKTASAGWYTAVPEPTSGLLLLLGMAGLALRRRRA